MINNLNNFYKLREEAINFFRNYTEMLSDANYNARQNKAEGTGLKICFPKKTPKKFLPRLPISLAKVKAGNNSEILLNKIRQIVSSLYQSKQITKRVHNHIIESIS